MALISRFDGAVVAGQNIVLLGDQEEKIRTAKKIIQTWPVEAGGLVILDRTGELFTSCAREQDILCSGIHQNSFMPDYIKPALLHPIIGANPRTAAEYLCAVLSPISKDLGTKDDGFWNSMGRKLNYDLWTFQLVEFRARCLPGDNATIWMAKNDKALRDLQEGVLLGSTTTTSTTTAISNNITITTPKVLTRTFEKGHMDLLQWLKKQDTLDCGDASPIYYDSLGRFSGKQNINTGHCIVQTADTHMQPMRELFETIGFFRDMLAEETPTFDLGAYTNVPGGKAVFVTGWRRGRPTDTALARLAVGGFAAAADNNEKPITFLIHEVDQWNVSETIQYLASRFGDVVNFITGIRSEATFRSQIGVDKNSPILDALEDLTCTDINLWHHSENKAMKTAFDERAKADRMYGLDDLVEGMMALEHDGNVQGYMMMEPVIPMGQTLVEKRQDNTNNIPWFLQKEAFNVPTFTPPTPSLPNLRLQVR